MGLIKIIYIVVPKNTEKQINFQNCSYFLTRWLHRNLEKNRENE